MAASANTDLSWSRDEAADANPDLTRKRQRLSEEADTSPLSTDPDGDVVIEALPPDEIGTNFDNAIALDDEDDMGLSLSDSFCLEPSTTYGPVQQLEWLVSKATSLETVNPEHLNRLTRFISDHLEDTRNSAEGMFESYVEEYDFISRIGQACFTLLERQLPLFDHRTVQHVGIAPLHELVATFHDAVYELSCRVLLLLPSVVDKTIARRDSGQVAKTRQHVGFLWYTLTLAQTLCAHKANQSTGFFKDGLNYKPAANCKLRKGSFLQQQRLIGALFALLKQLTQHHRELSNAWEGIDAILRIYKSIDCGEEVETVMDILHLHILPVICDKHPRALPDNFHELSIHLGSTYLGELMEISNMEEAAGLYESYVKSENDALTMESAQDTSVVHSLENVSGGDSDTLIELVTTAWTLARLKSFIYSDIMDVRSAGISMLSSKLLELYNAHRSGKDNYDHPVLQYVARFMRANELTKYIFGPNSHASLVNHSQNIIGFLAATFAYTNLESDIIWHACTNSVETEFVKASFTVLADLCRYLDLDHLLYLANKYAITPPSKLGKDAVESLTDLFQRVQVKSASSADHRHRLATAFISIDILLRIANIQEYASLLPLRDTARNELSRFTGPPYSREDRARILARCVPNLVEPNEHATTSVEILTMFLPGLRSPQEAQDLLDMLPVQSVVDELGHYVNQHRETASDGKHVRNLQAGLQQRLIFAIQIMALPGAKVDAAARMSLFRYIFGDLALNNAVRDYCWNVLSSLVTSKSFQPQVNVVAQDLILHFVNTEALKLDLQFMTPKLIELFGVSLQGQAKTEPVSDDYSSFLESPTWQKLVQAAESIGVPQVSHPATEALCEILFVCPRQSEKLHAAAQCQANFARQQIDHIRDNFDDRESTGGATICQKLSLLDAVLKKSRHFPSHSPPADTDLCLATEPEEELFQCAIQVYGGGQTQPNLYRLQANSSTTVSELMAVLPSLTGAADNRAIVGGKSLDPESQANTALSRLGVQASGTVEQEVLKHFDDLERLLDGPDDTAAKAFHFLANISPPAKVREKVNAADSSVDELFPLTTRPWRSAYSLHVLDAHRKDFAKIGVADDNYILRGVRLLVALIANSAHSLQHPILGHALSVLTMFLQERPANASAVSWIEQPDVFVDRLVEICNFSVLHPPEAPESPVTLLTNAFKALFQACRVQNSVWKCFAENPRVLEMHKKVLMARDGRFPQQAGTLMKDFFTDASSSDEVAQFYAKTFLALLPDVLNNRHRAARADYFFFLAIESVHAANVLLSDENRAREMLDTLISAFWSYEHTESVDLPIPDCTVVGMLRLLIAVVEVVKSFKKPLALPDLAVQILTRMLFPPYMAPDARPLVDAGSRSLAYRLVQHTCESEADFAGILDATLAPMLDTSGNPGDRFPGLAGWIRPASNCSGLPNLGMTCYMNSLLQQLFANVHFRKFLFEVPIVDAGKQALLKEVQTLFAHMQNSYNPFPDTTALAAVLGIKTEQQEDVHQFYEGLLTSLEANMPDDTWKTQLQRFYTGKQLSQIKGECGHVSPKTEPFVDLQVVVKNKANLIESLDEYVQGEPMQGANKYKCQACDSTNGGRLVDAMRRACPEEIPDNLTFCLKRFAFEALSGMETKVNDRFEFPQTINMSPYKAAHLENPSSKAEEDIFELVGVIDHQGTMALGHYWSYTLLRNTALPFSRTWVKLEDRNVSVVQGGLQEIQNECSGGLYYNNGNERVDSAYLLFYERRSSLEENLALPGFVVDPNTKALLPPKVLAPADLAANIHRDNAWRFRIAHLFHDEFANFITWLMEQYRHEYKSQGLDARKSTASAGSDLSSDQDGSAKSSDSGERPAEGWLAEKVSAVAMTYLQRVAPCDTVIPIRRVNACISMLDSLVQAQPEFNTLCVNRVVADPAWFEAVLNHEQPKVRTVVGQFIIACLERLREFDQAFYRQAFKQLSEIHSKPNKNLASVQSLHWQDYFKFATCLAGLGPSETETILDEGYWEWAFKLLYLPYSSGLKKKLPGLVEHLRENSGILVALYDFIHSILDKHVDLCTSLTEPMQDDIHVLTEQDGLVLNTREVESLLSRCNGKSQNVFHWMKQSKHAKQDCSWKDSAPGKLVGLLSSRKSTAEMVLAIKQSLIDYIEQEEDNLAVLVHMTMQYCSNCPSEEDAWSVFHALARVIHMWENSEGVFLKVLPDAYQIFPRIVLSTMEAWAPSFLQAKTASIRDETSKWLEEKVFDIDSIFQNLDFDAERARQARSLARLLAEFLNQAYVNDKARSRFEGPVKLVQTLDNFLRTLQAKIGDLPAETINLKLRTEVDEISQTLNSLTELEAETLSLWQLDAQETQGDVRASVEASDGFVSSDDWDEGDDDSLSME